MITLSYDFSIDATQAYEINMREMEYGVFAFFQPFNNTIALPAL
jgi:hypothetical protein